MKVLDYSIACHTNPILTRHLWHLGAFFQWDPVVWVFNELCNQQPVIDVAEAWERITQIYNQHPELMEQRRQLDVALGRITLRAWETNQRSSWRTGPEPGFISSLRDIYGRRKTAHPTFEMAADSSQTSVASPPTPESDFVDFDVNSISGEIDWTFWDQLLQNSSETFLTMEQL